MEPVPIIREPEPAPIQPGTVVRKPEPEVQRRQPEVERKPEVETPPPAQVEAKKPDLEEKTSIQKKKLPEPEEKATRNGKKWKHNGKGGRKHTEAQISEILDMYLLTGELPLYVSEKQRWLYRHHERLPERRQLLEQAGLSIDTDVSSTTGHPKNIVQLPGTHVQRKISSSK